MTVADLIEVLKGMPQDAMILTYSAVEFGEQPQATFEPPESRPVDRQGTPLDPNGYVYIA